MRKTLVVAVLLVGCKSHAPKKGTPGELCIAENKAEQLPADAKLEVAVSDVRMALPNPEKLVTDVGGLAVTMFKDGKKSESVRLDFAKRQTDKLCLYYRPAGDHGGGGWKLDNGDHPRCHCWGAPATGSGAGSAGSAAPAATGSGGSAVTGSAATGAAATGSAGSATP